MTTLEVLEKARELIADPARWCQEAVALDKTGERVPSMSVNAVRWCVVGAVVRAGRDAGWTGTFVPIWNLLDRETRVLSRFADAVAANDYGKHDLVIRIFDRAIADLRAKGGG